MRFVYVDGARDATVLPEAIASLPRAREVTAGDMADETIAAYGQLEDLLFRDDGLRLARAGAADEETVYLQNGATAYAGDRSMGRAREVCRIRDPADAAAWSAAIDRTDRYRADIVAMRKLWGARMALAHMRRIIAQCGYRVQRSIHWGGVELVPIESPPQRAAFPNWRIDEEQARVVAGHERQIKRKLTDLELQRAREEAIGLLMRRDNAVFRAEGRSLVERDNAERAEDRRKKKARDRTRAEIARHDALGLSPAERADAWRDFDRDANPLVRVGPTIRDRVRELWTMDPTIGAKRVARMLKIGKTKAQAELRLIKGGAPEGVPPLTSKSSERRVRVSGHHLRVAVDEPGDAAGAQDTDSPKTVRRRAASNTGADK